MAQNYLPHRPRYSSSAAPEQQQRFGTARHDPATGNLLHSEVNQYGGPLGSSTPTNTMTPEDEWRKMFPRPAAAGPAQPAPAAPIRPQPVAAPAASLRTAGTAAIGRLQPNGAPSVPPAPVQPPRSANPLAALSQAANTAAAGASGNPLFAAGMAAINRSAPPTPTAPAPVAAPAPAAPPVPVAGPRGAVFMGGNPADALRLLTRPSTVTDGTADPAVIAAQRGATAQTPYGTIGVGHTAPIAPSPATPNAGSSIAGGLGAAASAIQGGFPMPPKPASPAAPAAPYVPRTTAGYNAGTAIATGVGNAASSVWDAGRTAARNTWDFLRGAVGMQPPPVTPDFPREGLPGGRPGGTGNVPMPTGAPSIPPAPHAPIVGPADGGPKPLAANGGTGEDELDTSAFPRRRATPLGSAGSMLA